jgi:endonuclease YncB( thermonuclease family)
MAAPVPSPQPPPAAVIQGAVQQVPNTDTLVVAGRRIRLAGVSGEPAMAAGLRGWLQSQGNQVRCTPTGQAYTCTTPGDLDVGRIVVFNGAGRAAADASQDYLDAEAQARSRGVGVWGR